ncbi:macro domain-containing protein [Pedobacter sp. L105]|uniref:type II toxin-antitoxin system antitoxin DNA ADP-ribosyl glycohydrolase DarG n=1 Tax=Pedobacter sp. L105 TaxID=1641871 RepID=UPI00131D0396|nr:macro domain-containing protein [Pedobacter sp. L105]
MIEFVTGNLLESPAEALVNTVNTVGVMGKGIALQFKKQFPSNYKTYEKACKNKTFHTGELLINEEESLLNGKKTIINFPTKTDWRKPSEYSYIETGLKELVLAIQKRNIKSIAIPPLGAGNGGLEWNKVKSLMQQYLSEVDSNIYIYQPTTTIQEVLKKERVKLTPARAMLLSVLFDLVNNGEFVSEFASEKIAYFLQRFGAQDIFKLDFQPNFYGPYSGKVKHVLYYLNGSYITGYSSKDKKPFEELGIMRDSENDVINYLNEPANLHLREIVERTKQFLTGFYSSFGLELLSTIDFIAQQYDTKSPDKISAYLYQWSDRKKTLFSNERFVNLAIERLSNNNL